MKQKQPNKSRQLTLPLIILFFIFGIVALNIVHTNILQDRAKNVASKILTSSEISNYETQPNDPYSQTNYKIMVTLNNETEQKHTINFNVELSGPSWLEHQLQNLDTSLAAHESKQLSLTLRSLAHPSDKPTTKVTIISVDGKKLD